jgi:hypothetical protein
VRLPERLLRFLKGQQNRNVGVMRLWKFKATKNSITIKTSFVVACLRGVGGISSWCTFPGGKNVIQSNTPRSNDQLSFLNGAGY